jgi:uncharacterized protein
MDDVVRSSEVGIDLHTAANRRTNVPQLRIDTSDARALGAGRVFGAPYVLDASLRPGRCGSASHEGVPVLTYEAGEPLRFDESAIDHRADGILRVLVHLDMIDEAPPGTHPGGHARVTLAARRAGRDPRPAGGLGRTRSRRASRCGHHQPAGCRACATTTA